MDCPSVTTETKWAIDYLTREDNGATGREEEEAFVTLSSGETLPDRANKKKGSDFLHWGSLGQFPASEK
jgi:hypothetical protein